MKSNHRLPIEFSLGLIKCKGTLEKMKGKGNETYYHTSLEGLRPSEKAIQADFYPIRVELMDRILVKWECKSDSLADSYRYPMAAAIVRKLKESKISLF